MVRKDAAKHYKSLASGAFRIADQWFSKLCRMIIEVNKTSSVNEVSSVNELLAWTDGPRAGWDNNISIHVAWMLN